MERKMSRLLFWILFLVSFMILGASPAWAASGWCQWLGGSGEDRVLAVVCDGDEIFAAGYSDSASGWETMPFYGTHSGGKEGFVVKITGGETPTLNWCQWLGGLDDDAVQALAIDGDEIYAGGWTYSDSSWEPIAFEGDYSGGAEGFVVEIQDGATPTLNWGQWLGGSSGTWSNNDYVYTLAINGDEIYAGGRTWSDTNWEVTFPSSPTGKGFVVEIQDGPTPTTNWGQKLGGINAHLDDLAVNGDEIYAVGTSSSSSSNYIGISMLGYWAGRNDEVFMIKVEDNDVTHTPNVPWGHWLGAYGHQHKRCHAVAVSGDEIYVGAEGGDSRDMEGPRFQGRADGGYQNFVAELKNGGTPWGGGSRRHLVAWGLWLSGTNDQGKLYDIVVDGDVIYAAGYTTSRSDPWRGWESAEYNGTNSGDASGYYGQFEGYLVKIEDGDTTEMRGHRLEPLKWVQWIGGSGHDVIYSIAVDGENVYAAGYSESIDDWEPFSFNGSFSGASEGFVVSGIPSSGQDGEDASGWFGVNF